jgi:hypothetical protein
MKTLLAIGASFVFLGGIAVAQSTDQRNSSTASSCCSGAMLLIDRGAKGKIKIKCAEADSTRQCVQAVLPIIPPDQVQGPGVAFATTSIKCGNTVFEISTGTKGGGCSIGGIADQQHSNADCKDGDNTASANCTQGCGLVTGSGSCTIH